MKALTVQQPWAWAIVHGGKIIENRSRNIAGGYRGPLAIHAGLRGDDAAYDDDMIRDALGRYDDSWLLEEQVGQRGAIVGVIDLTSVHHSRECDTGDGGRCSSWAQTGDLWHLRVADPQPLAEPIPCRGALGLWTLPVEVRAQLELVLGVDEWVDEIRSRP